MPDSKTILIVEDNEDTRFVLGAILNHDGYRVLEASDGREGVWLATSSLPDLILMDIRMPGMGGFEAAEELRDDERTREIPILAVTADRFDGRRQQRAETLFDACLWKPLEPTRLRDHVRRYIGEP